MKRFDGIDSHCELPCTGKLTHAARRRPLGLAHRRDLGFDKCQMMRDVAGDAFQEGFEGEGTCFGMDASSLEVFDIGVPEDDGHLTPHSGDQFQLVVDAAFLIVEAGGKDVRVTAKHSGIVFHEHSLHAIRVNGLKIGDVTHDLANRPFARHRSPV